jgi:hypothetical protein
VQALTRLSPTPLSPLHLHLVTGGRGVGVCPDTAISLPVTQLRAMQRVSDLRGLILQRQHRFMDVSNRDTFVASTGLFHVAALCRRFPFLQRVENRDLYLLAGPGRRFHPSAPLFARARLSYPMREW